MEGQPDHQAGQASRPAAKTLYADRVRPLGAVVVKRVREVRRENEKPSSPKSPHLGYAFVPYPVELSEMEQKRARSSLQLRILGLRRFADPVTGLWITTSQHLAHLVYADRTTLQKALRALEFAQFLYFHYLRSRTVHIAIRFSGFPQPPYIEEGRPPLRWDAGFTPATGHTAHQSAHRSDPPHSPAAEQRGEGQPQSALSTPKADTVANRYSLSNELGIRSNEYSLLGGGQLVSVDNYTPRSHDESVVHDLARKLGERFMNSFFSLRRTYGLARLQRACGLAQDKQRDTRFPLRQPPGAYVRWLLQNGKC